MVRAILQQVVHHPTVYTAEMAMRQAAMFMLRHPSKYYKYVEEDLLYTGESYESFVYNVFHCNVWGDDLIAAVFGDMWNIAISIVSPTAKKPFHLFHNKVQPDVVLVCNGGNYMRSGGATHFCATRSTDPGFRKPGSELNPTISQDMTAKLDPIVLESKDKAKQVALNEYLKDDRENSLDLLRTVCTGLKRLDNRIADLIQQSDGLHEQKNLLTFQLEKLGVKKDEIRGAMEELGERPFCRTLEREKQDVEEEKKRKLEEEEEERERKRMKVIPTVKGVEVEDYFQGLKDSEGTAHEEKMTTQLNELLKSREIVIQEQEKTLAEQQQTIIQQQRLILNQQLSNRAQEVSCSSSSIPGSFLPGTSIKIGGSGTIDNFLKPEELAFLHTGKQDKPDIKEGDVVISEEIPDMSTSRSNVPVLPSQLQISQEPNPEKVVYLPKEVPESESLILVPTRMKKTTSLRASTQPVPEKLQNESLHYCTKCKAKYTTRDELNRHKAKNCQVKEPEFFCDECEASFFWPNTIREHYYKEHIKKYLYHCRKCGKGFHWKSRIPDHNKKCPMKDGPDKFEGKLPYDENIEKKFQRKKAVPLILPQDDSQHREQEQFPTSSVEQQPMLQPSVYPPVQSTATPNQPTPQLVCDEDPPLDRVLQVPSTDPSITVQLATVQPLSEGGTESTADNVLQMLSQGRLPNIASEIEGVEEEEEEEKDIKPIVLDVENKFEQ